MNRRELNPFRHNRNLLNRFNTVISIGGLAVFSLAAVREVFKFDYTAAANYTVTTAVIGRHLRNIFELQRESGLNTSGLLHTEFPDNSVPPPPEQDQFQPPQTPEDEG